MMNKSREPRPIFAILVLGKISSRGVKVVSFCCSTNQLQKKFEDTPVHHEISFPSIKHLFKQNTCTILVAETSFPVCSTVLGR